jgi:hypothetical protein
MKFTAKPAACPWFDGLLAPVGLILTAGILLVLDVGRSSNLSATVANDPDSDGDGLTDRQEFVLGTLIFSVDSDQDGYPDAEELARKTSPIFSQSFPENPGLCVGLTAHGERDGLHAVIAIYLPTGDYQNLDVRVGTVVGHRLLFVPQPTFLANSTIGFSTAHDPSAAVALIDFRFDRDWVLVPGHLTMFVTVARASTGKVIAADAMDLFNMGGIPTLAVPDPSQYHAILAGRERTTGPGTIYRPLMGIGDDVPTGWAADQICYQTSQAVAVNGAMITSEVVTAECESGWDGSCAPDCHSFVGTTYTSVDPVILVGG